MPESRDNPTPLSSLLREGLREAIEKHGLRPVSRASGVAHPSLIRFLRGELRLRLDMADRLADYLGIEAVRRPKERKE
jgi:plasmid maintenance system antidote protein VapI